MSFALYANRIKRWLDLTLSALGLLILSPLFVAITTILFVSNRGVPFFKQERPGLNELPFRLIKFKTMTDATDSDGNLLPNHLRITGIGRVLRKSSLDELPQLINVIRGEMSLIGPRPLLFKYIPLYSTTQKRRHEVRPGISGWAQVNGRNAISWRKKFELDVFYVDNISFVFDLKILLMTFAKVFKTIDVNAGENVTMPPFDGKN